MLSSKHFRVQAATRPLPLPVLIKLGISRPAIALALSTQFPLTNVPSYVQGYACDMAAYLLMTRAGLLNSDDDGEDEIVSRAKNARVFFEKWAEGGFDGGDKSGIPNARQNRVRISSPTKMDLRGY